ncbi:enoyl-CoA hydratase-related protein [Streptomyces sp. NPDC047061]|uniref:enoyl-CoA hydratase-related protein n=1 Tax=Streptomyces sp. NPDC047061 TaxID=3154605 RepID=UPI00340B1B49
MVWPATGMISSVKPPASVACDLVVADENATFGMPEVHHGLFPAAGGVLRLQYRLPRNIAREIALTGGRSCGAVDPWRRGRPTPP